MSQVQLQIKPRRVRCSQSCEPPPFQFAAASAAAPARPRRGIAFLPVRLVALVLRLVGLTIDTAFFLIGLAIWCSLHIVLWSYAFDMGPAADCFGLPCPPVVEHRMLIACAALAVVTFIGARILTRLGHKATATVMLMLVTFDVAALMLLAVGMLT